MIKLFRNIRQNLLAEGKTSKYFQYALGEIVLVVIGILIALQINNWNENRKERIQEVKYLENIKSDIAIEQINNDRMLELRLKKAEAASGMLFRKTPKGAQELEVFEESWRLVYFWQSYIPNNSVFKELSSSGHLNEITSDSLKFYLLDLDKRYTAIDHLEHHMRREYEQYLYDPAITHTEILNFYKFKNMVQNERDNVIDTATVVLDNIPALEAEFDWLLTAKTIRNGLKLAAMNNLVLSRKHLVIKKHMTRITELIEEDLKKD